MSKKNKKKSKLKEKGGDFGPIFDLSQETRNSIWGIISIALAILSIMAFFEKAGSAGRAFHSVSQSLFGWGIFLVPLVFIFLGVIFFRSISHNVYNSALAGIGLFVLSFLGIFYIIGTNNDLSIRISQGGYLGVILGYPALSFLGFTASFIVFIFIIIVAILVTLNVPIHGFIMKDEDKTEKKESEKEPMPANDNIIIKRGAELVQDRPDGGKDEPIMTSGKKTTVDEDKEFQIKTSSSSGKWVTPPLKLLHSDSEHPKSGDISANVGIIKRTLSNFNIDVEMGEVSIGPTVTQYTLRPAVGVKLSKITALQNDMALALAAHPIRVEAPIPGKSLVGIEVPNTKAATVGLRDLLNTGDFQKTKSFLPLSLGRDVAGFPVFAALDKMPHLLVAGATGSGKSVCINTVILSLLYKHSPDILKFIMIDPKRVELSLYNHIPHLITPVITENKKAASALKWAVKEMERRYELLSSEGVRDISSYNTKQAQNKNNLMPFIVVIIDELADLMSSFGKDVEGAIVRLAQMARAVGIHLIVSTQRPSVEVITGLIKANITSRIAFQVASSIDSRTILDASGAERLLGKGDMLFQSGDTSKPRRVQGALVTEEEVKEVTAFIKDQADNLYETEETKDELNFDLNDTVEAGKMGGDEGVDDDLYGDAKELVVRAQKASASMLQRHLRVGYARAARLLDILEENGVVGPADGAKPRDVYIGAQDDGTTAEVAPSSSENSEEI